MRSLRVVTESCGLAVLILLSVAGAVSQAPVLPHGLRTTTRTPDEAAYRQIQIQRALEGQQRQEMRDLEATARASVKLPREKLPKLTEADRKRIEALLMPDPHDVAANKEILDQPRTGIFRLFPNSNCETKRHIRVDGDCANHIPGGSHYSFRPGAITPDIHFNNGQLVGEGFFSQIIVTELGDLPILNLSRAVEKLDLLNDFAPAKDLAGVGRQRAEILKSAGPGGRPYSKTVLAKLNSTYAMRIVAYRNDNNLIRRLPLEGMSADNAVISFQKVQADNRFDLVVVFRVIRRDADGNITILWKELSRKKSPVITFGRDEPLSDFK